jgi:fructokinase
VAGAETELGVRGSVGMAIPGSESFGSNLIKNANTTYLNGKPLRLDLEKSLGRPVRLANDANCFALSEASDGSAVGAGTVFGVIAGTGVGGGVVVDGKVLGGAHGIGGEWGHIPLPTPSVEEVTTAPLCYCGKRGCLEVWCSGPGLVADFKRIAGREASAEEIATSEGADERAAMDRLIDRFARAMATMVNILDPDVIVMGGGLSNVERLYRDLPPLVEKYGFNLGGPPRIVKNTHGDSSGVRGAAWLWPA